MGNGESRSAEPQNDGPVPKAVVSRLSLYLRELQHLIRSGRETTSSTQLGSRLGFTDAQVRKDLAYFGQFGYPGIGYKCDELVREVKRIMGTDRRWPVAVVGLGNLGAALLGHRGFANQGFQIVAAFEADPNKIGQRIQGVEVRSLEELPAIVAQQAIRLAIIAVPAAAAQQVADLLVASGITGILNFAPTTILLPHGVSEVAVDLAIELEQLSFAVVNRSTNS